MKGFTFTFIVLLLSAAITCTLAKVPQLGGPNNPIKAIYIDDGNWDHPEESIVAAAQAGFNAIILAFYMHTGPSDFVQAWESVDSQTQQATVATLHGLDAVLMMSFGGGADANPYDSDPYSMGQLFAKYAVSQYCDGVDFDLENINDGFTVNNMNSSELVDWIVQITLGAASVVGLRGVISHAPQSPYFGPIGDNTTWVGPSGGYTAVYQQSQETINFFNVQYYNQGCYTDYESSFIYSGGNCSDFPQTSVKEIAAAGVPINTILMGKPVHQGDADDGWVSGTTLAQWFKQAASDIQWNGGVMGWEWTDDGTTSSWLQSIYPNSSSTTTSSTYFSLFEDGPRQQNGGKGSFPVEQIKAFKF